MRCLPNATLCFHHGWVSPAGMRSSFDAKQRQTAETRQPSPLRSFRDLSPRCPRSSCDGARKLRTPKVRDISALVLEHLDKELSVDSARRPVGHETQSLGLPFYAAVGGGTSVAWSWAAEVLFRDCAQAPSALGIAAYRRPSFPARRAARRGAQHDEARAVRHDGVEAPEPASPSWTRPRKASGALATKACRERAAISPLHRPALELAKLCRAARIVRLARRAARRASRRCSTARFNSAPKP